MGCDYYLNTYICIFYNDNTKSEIILERERGYFNTNFCIDNNNPRYYEIIDENFEKQIQDIKNPFIIYENNEWKIDEILKNEYEYIIKNILENAGKEMNEIIKIEKIERKIRS